mmetsp:Transcript_119855/g.339223  ORF Transcript_119855/g.339223 Transcript_119855/m.339223 type:complete len:360 (+) Transcript_119855:214-1293(+)
MGPRVCAQHAPHIRQHLLQRIPRPLQLDQQRLHLRCLHLVMGLGLAGMPPVHGLEPLFVFFGRVRLHELCAKDGHGHGYDHDARNHRQHRDEAPQVGRRGDVAIPHRGHRGDRPIETVRYALERGAPPLALPNETARLRVEEPSFDVPDQRGEDEDSDRQEGAEENQRVNGTVHRLDDESEVEGGARKLEDSEDPEEPEDSQELEVVARLSDQYLHPERYHGQEVDHVHFVQYKPAARLGGSPETHAVLRGEDNVYYHFNQRPIRPEFGMQVSTPVRQCPQAERQAAEYHQHHRKHVRAKGALRGAGVLQNAMHPVPATFMPATVPRRGQERHVVIRIIGVRGGREQIPVLGGPAVLCG